MMVWLARRRTCLLIVPEFQVSRGKTWQGGGRPSIRAVTRVSLAQRMTVHGRRKCRLMVGPETLRTVGVRTTRVAENGATSMSDCWPSFWVHTGRRRRNAESLNTESRNTQRAPPATFQLFPRFACAHAKGDQVCSSMFRFVMFSWVSACRCAIVLVLMVWEAVWHSGYHRQLSSHRLPVRPGL